MIICVAVVCVSSRDFGPMLTAEREAMMAKKESRGEGGGGGRGSNDGSGGGTDEGYRALFTGRCDSVGSPMTPIQTLIELTPGPLAPKQGVPHRW